MRLTLTRDERYTDSHWTGIKPLRSLSEVAEILGMTELEVQCAERIAFRKLRDMLPPARNRLEAARAIEVSYLFSK